jgi:hypothetical protein
MWNLNKKCHYTTLSITYACHDYSQDLQITTMLVNKMKYKQSLHLQINQLLEFVLKFD